MNSTLAILAVPLIALQLFVVEQKINSCKEADLTVLEIYPPDYNSQIDGTTITVVVKNIGLEESKPCSVNIFDLDISYEEVLETSADSTVLELIAENNGRAEYYNKSNNSSTTEIENIDEDELDYDTNWELTHEIPALKPNQEYTITVDLHNHWIYDANCEIRVIIDPEKEIEDCDRKNNQLDFFDWG